MGMKILIEVEVSFPDLSIQKHVDMLRAVFKQNKVYGVKTVKLITASRPMFVGEQIYPELCLDCNGSGSSDGNRNSKASDCGYCGGSGLKK